MIPNEFFIEEIRDGYCISEMMKRSWASQLSILESLKKLFNKYGLQYFADYGSLLGAVRHRGYVPWDDDLDIAMPRKDFMILLEHADEIDDGLMIRSVYNSETYMNFNAVVTHKADTLTWDESRMDRYYDCPFICYVDIFIWDYVPKDEKAYVIQRELHCLAYKLIYDLGDIENRLFGAKTVTLNELKLPILLKDEGVREFQKSFNTLQELIVKHLKGGITFFSNQKLRQQLCIATDKIAQMYPREDADYVEYFPFLRINRNNRPRRKSGRR